jgi:mgtE-like transporter
MVLGVMSLALNGVFTVSAIAGILVILLLSNVIAFVVIVLVSYAISIMTFKRGLDPDNFVIPLGSSLADALTTLALFITLLLLL